MDGVEVESFSVLELGLGEGLDPPSNLSVGGIEGPRFAFVAVHFVLDDIRLDHVVEQLPSFIRQVFDVVELITLEWSVEKQLKQESQHVLVQRWKEERRFVLPRKAGLIFK